MSVGDYIGWAYLIGVFVSWWFLASIIAWSDKSTWDLTPAGDDLVFGVFVGAFLAAIWPISLPAALVITSGHEKKSRLLWTPPKYRAELNKALAENQQRRIRELERELEMQR